MRKLAIFLALLPLITAAQVRVASPATAQRECKYDSTENTTKQPECLIGQDLFVIPLEKDVYIQSYYSFGRSIETTNGSTVMKGKIDPSCVRGHTFHVTDKIDDTFQGLSKSGRYYLQLVDKETNDTIYYRHGLFPFIVIGYKEKMESTYGGKLFVYRWYGLRNFDTGESKENCHKSTWTFKEVIAVPNETEPRYFFTNSEGVGTVVSDFNEFILKSDISSFKKKYGAAMVDLALDGEVKVGMASDLVKIAKGNPDKINSASYGQQWVYKNVYIYIKNGKVTGWN